MFEKGRFGHGQRRMRVAVAAIVMRFSATAVSCSQSRINRRFLHESRRGPFHHAPASDDGKTHLLGAALHDLQDNVGPGLDLARTPAGFSFRDQGRNERVFVRLVA